MAATDPVAAVINASPALDSASRSDVRRRQGVAAAKKTDLEAVPNGENSGAGADHLVSDRGSNRSRAMKRDRGLERPRDSPPSNLKGIFAAQKADPQARQARVLNGMNNRPVAARDLEERVSGLESDDVRMDISKMGERVGSCEQELKKMLASGGARVVRHSEAYLRKGFWGVLEGGAGGPRRRPENAAP